MLALLRETFRGLKIASPYATWSSNLSFDNIRNAYVEKQASPLDVTQVCLSNIKKDKKLNDFITLNENNALEQASSLSLSVDSSPLFGLPYALKDNFATLDLRTTCGSKMLSTFVPNYDSAVSQILRDSDAVLIGKSNLDAFAMGSFTTHSDFGPVYCRRFPSAASHVNDIDGDTMVLAGGSSGGSASAVASKHCSFAIGSDTGGSVRLPAAFCNIVGFKPSYGLLSRWGLVAYASSLDTVGIMANNIGDAESVFQTLLVPDSRDPSQVDFQKLLAIRQQPSTLSSLPDNLVIGVPLESMYIELSKELLSFWTRLLEHLSRFATIKFVSIPTWQHALPTYYTIASCEAASNLARYDGVRFGHRTEKPVLTFSDLVAESRGEAFSPEIQKRILLGHFALSSSHFEDMYIRSQKIRRCLSDEFHSIFKEIDVLLTPTSPHPAISSQTSHSIDEYLVDNFTVPASLAGLPAISLPSSWFERESSFGIQLTTSFGTDKTLLAIAKLFSQEFCHVNQ